MAQENIRNPELVLALNVFKAEDTPAARRAIATALGTAKLLAPVVLEQLPQEQPGAGALQAKVKYTMFAKPDGTKLFPAFTDMDEMKKWQAEPGQTVVMRLQDYVQLLMREGAGLVINPQGQNVFVPKQMVFPAPKPVVFDKSRPIGIADPTDLPEKIRDCVQNALSAQPQIKEGWLRIMQQDQKRAWLMVLALDEGVELKQVMEPLLKAMAPVMGQSSITLTLRTSDLGKQATAQGLPIYLRG